MEKIIDLTLPAFAFLDIPERNVILHVRSASVVEVLEYDNSFITADVPTYRFDYKNIYGLVERMIAVLHYSTTLEDWDDITEQVLKPAAQWYMDDCTRMDLAED